MVQTFQQIVERDVLQHLYVIEILGRGVKVGITRVDQKDVRLACHRSQAEAYGCKIGRLWFSDPHYGARENERALKFLMPRGQRKREYLPLDFDEVVTYAKSLLPVEQAGLTPIEYVRQLLSST